MLGNGDTWWEKMPPTSGVSEELILIFRTFIIDGTLDWKTVSGASDAPLSIAIFLKIRIFSNKKVSSGSKFLGVG